MPQHGRPLSSGSVTCQLIVSCFMFCFSRLSTDQVVTVVVCYGCLCCLRCLLAAAVPHLGFSDGYAACWWVQGLGQCLICPR